MKTLYSAVLFLCLCRFSPAASAPTVDPLPAAVTDNAVAGVKSHGKFYVLSLMGIGPKRTWDAVTNAVYNYDNDEGQWTPVRPVPGSAGRIGAAAVGAEEQLYLAGGAVIDPQGRSTPVPDMNVYEPVGDHWTHATDMPTAVTDAVIGVFHDNFIYVIGGRSQNGATNKVQIYDLEKNSWQQATPFPGAAVFGHAGAIVGDTIVYVGGAKPNPEDAPAYISSDECWMGKIDKKTPAKITWSKLPNHPGDAQFRIAAGGSEKDDKIYFVGGAANPYDLKGKSYDGKPVVPAPVIFDFNLKSGKWETIDEKNPHPTMDHRGLIASSQGLIILGGTEAEGKITNSVLILPKLPNGK